MLGIKKTIISLGILLLLFIIWLQPFNFGTTEVTIPKGANATDIARFLSENQVVRDAREFLLWLRISGKEKYLKSGTYTLSKYGNPLYVINQLTKGGKSDIIVTIPEGLTIYETGDILDTRGVCDKKSFIALCTDPIFVKKLKLQGNTLEGYLFPDTYAFSSLQNDTQIVSIFITNFKDHLLHHTMPGKDSLYRILILASLVEKEAKFENERPIIARVFMNRLETNRPLESCATVLYALKTSEKNAPTTKKKLLKRDLKYQSPYNTYIHTGLPPGPICSPGEKSIEAAIKPADVEYMYFVAKGDGSHHFSRTFREHIAAKERYNAQN